MYKSLLQYKNRFYGKAALALVVLSILLYLSHGNERPASGDSWQGYLLGTLGLLLILWLSWLGIRKRRYHSNVGSVQGWTSAHVYLGLSLIIVATLHTAFQFGFNVHTVAYVLMCGVIVSGIYGLYAYTSLPTAIIRNRREKSMDAWLEELDQIDKQSLELAANCSADVQSILVSSIQRTAIGAGFWQQLWGRDDSKAEIEGSRGRLSRNVDQQAVIAYLAAKLPDTTKAGEAQRLQKLLHLVGRRAEILRHLRRDLSYNARLKVWLLFHIPLTVGLLCALVIHVISVFFYW